jgi:hypothetical protein
LARIDRAELGDFDALVLGLLLMAHFKGQIVVPDFGFYGRELHQAYIREERPIAGVNFLGELPVKLRQDVLLIKDKVPNGAILEDAEMIAQYAAMFRAPSASPALFRMQWRDGWRRRSGSVGHFSQMNALSLAATISSSCAASRFNSIGR